MATASYDGYVRLYNSDFRLIAAQKMRKDEGRRQSHFPPTGLRVAVSSMIQRLAPVVAARGRCLRQPRSFCPFPARRQRDGRRALCGMPHGRQTEHTFLLADYGRKALAISCVAGVMAAGPPERYPGGDECHSATQGAAHIGCRLGRWVPYIAVLGVDGHLLANRPPRSRTFPKLVISLAFPRTGFQCNSPMGPRVRGSPIFR